MRDARATSRWIKLRGSEVLRGDAARVPVVLAHGVFGFGNVRVGPVGYGYWFGVDRLLHRAGHSVLVARVPFSAPIAERGATLARQVRAFVDEVRVPPVIVAHSMGGLDARHALTHLGLAERTRGLVTVATSHRGSPAADWVFDKLGDERAVGWLMRLGLDVRGARELRTGPCRAFNDATPDVAGFPYFSVAAVRDRARTFVGLRPTHDVIAAAEGANDGLVSRASAAWGTVLPEWDCDHPHSRNQRLWRETGPARTGDVGSLYLDVISRVTA